MTSTPGAGYHGDCDRCGDTNVPLRYWQASEYLCLACYDEETMRCTKAIPKALVQRGHDWGRTGFAGVILGASRCVNCNVVASPAHFPAHKVKP